MKRISKKRETELAIALDAYTDPNSPEYDPEFDAQMREMRPDWFEKGSKVKQGEENYNAQ